MKHGDLWAGLALDNLSAHITEDVKKFFADGHVLLVHFPLETAESAQPIGAGCDRLARRHVGNLLGK